MQTPEITGWKPRRAVSILCCASLLAACAGTPIAVDRMHATAVQRELNRSILTSDRLSALTHNVLFKHDLLARYEDDPTGAIAALHAARRARAAQPRRSLRRGRAVVRARRAQRRRRSSPCGDGLRLDVPVPPRRPTAAAQRLRRAGARRRRHLQPRARARLRARPERRVRPGRGRYELPFGHLDVAFDAAQLVRGERKLTNFVPVSELDVRGLTTRYRSPGIGAPLAASTEHVDPTREYDDYIEPWVKVSVTALLRLDDAEGQLANGRVKGRLTLEFTALETTVDIHGEKVPLETESTASLAYTFAEAPIWQRELGGFLQRIAPRRREQPARYVHALPSWHDSRGARARNRLEPRALGADDERAAQRPAGGTAHSVLALHLRHRQSDPLFRDVAARIAAACRRPCSIPKARTRRCIRWS